MTGYGKIIWLRPEKTTNERTFQHYAFPFHIKTDSFCGAFQTGAVFSRYSLEREYTYIF